MRVRFRSSCVVDLSKINFVVARALHFENFLMRHSNYLSVSTSK